MNADSDASRTRYAMVVIAVLCQLASVALTWDLWQVRDQPINLPVRPDLPELSFGWAMVGSLVVAGLVPKFGVALHWIVLVIACLSDQFRLEPQFFGLAALMLVCYGEPGRIFNRWYLAAMWLWTGIHKLVSPDWTGYVSWQIIDDAGLPADQLYFAFAIAVAVAEISLGLLAWFRPLLAAKLCVVIHLGIVITLSPLVTGMNYSVIPWNLAIAIVGCWVLVRSDRGESNLSWRQRLSQKTIGELALLTLLMIVPAGFYIGWVDRCFSHVMYSGNLPRALITSQERLVAFDSYHGLGVPFPHERRLFRLYFERTAAIGDRMHIADPRSLLADEYLVMRPTGVWSIEPAEFFSLQGVGIDNKQSQFLLSQAGVRMLKKSEESMVYAVAFSPENFDRDLIWQLKGLPNLEQIELSDTAVRDEDLAPLSSLRQLSAIGLNRTGVTDRGLAVLADLPHLVWVESEATSITWPNER